MRTLYRDALRGVDTGEPLPSPWPIFDANKVSFRRGSIAMVAGPPGSMKTMFMANVVGNMGPKVPTLYHSSDSDKFTMMSRMLAMTTGQGIGDAELAVHMGRPEALKPLRKFNHIHWSWASSPTLDHMQREAEAFRETRGTYPHHTVIDVMMCIDYEGVAEQNYWSLMAELKDMAREQETAITVVHHTSESVKGGSPPPRSAIMGKANQLPTLILTLWGDGAAGILKVATVKNRSGPQDAMAGKYITMKASPAVCKIEEQEASTWTPVGMNWEDDDGETE